MADRVLPGPVPEDVGIREAVCIHTRKIYSSCRDKDCVEDLRFYPTQASQPSINSASSVRPRSAELLYADVDVEEIPFNRGYYTVDIRYFYRVSGETYSLQAGRNEITGLAIFDKRVILFGSEGGAKTFSSRTVLNDADTQLPPGSGLPTAVVSAVDPIILSMNLIDAPVEPVPVEQELSDIPAFISDGFDGELELTTQQRRINVTLGQFSMIRLERDSQLLMPAYDYCMPENECADPTDDTPCRLFSRISFPVEEFFPPDSVEAPEGYREVQSMTAR